MDEGETGRLNLNGPEPLSEAYTDFRVNDKNSRISVISDMNKARNLRLAELEIYQVSK